MATCDLYPSEIDYVPHFQGDALHVQNLGWDLVIAHPPCTYLAAVSSQWLSQEPGRHAALESAARVFKSMASATAPFVAVENPRMHAEARRLVGGLTPTQFVQPWEHGTGHQKATGLYLTKGLPPLQPTCVVDGRESAIPREVLFSPARGSFPPAVVVPPLASIPLAVPSMIASMSSVLLRDLRGGGTDV